MHEPTPSVASGEAGLSGKHWPAEPGTYEHLLAAQPSRRRDPDADAWIGEMERMRDQCVELVKSRFLMVIQSLDTGEAEGEVTAVIFVADDEKVGLRHALMNLLVMTDADCNGNSAGVEWSHHRGHQMQVAFDAADAGEIRDVAEALA